MASHSGVLATDRPYSGIMATIYDANSVRKDVDITNDKGRYSFTGLVSGPHQIRFFGRFYTEDDYIDVNIIDTDLATSTVPLTFVTTPTLSALETGTGKIDGSNNQLTTAQLTFANLSPSTGALTSIIVLFKPSFETTYEDKLEFKFAKEMTEVTNNGANAVFTATLPMFDEQQTTYDFKAQFVDQQGDVVIISNLVLEVTAQATFNGVSDFAEYIHVDGLEVKNIKDSSDNSMGDNTFILQ